MKTGYYISQKDYDKIINYAQAAYDMSKCEIGGMSVCYMDDEDDWIVADPVILKQKVTGGTCDLDKDALADYYCNAQKKHGKKEFRFCWWHSHHTMGVFWSSTDIKGIEEYSDGDMSFALVVNLKKENKFRISMWKPVIMHLDTELQIMGTKTSTVPKKIVDEVEALCDKPTPYVNPYAGKKWDNRTQGNLFKTSKYKSFNRGYMDTSDYGEYAEGKMNHGIDTGIEVNEFLGREYNHCYGFLVDLIDSLVNEGMEYEEYTRTLNKFNDRLKVLGGDWKVLTIEKNDVKPELEFEDIDKYITVKGKTMEELYFAEFSY